MVVQLAQEDTPPALLIAANANNAKIAINFFVVCFSVTHFTH